VVYQSPLTALLTKTHLKPENQTSLPWRPVETSWDVFVTTESQDLGLTSHPKDGDVLQFFLKKSLMFTKGKYKFSNITIIILYFPELS